MLSGRVIISLFSGVVAEQAIQADRSKSQQINSPVEASHEPLWHHKQRAQRRTTDTDISTQGSPHTELIVPPCQFVTEHLKLIKNVYVLK